MENVFLEECKKGSVRKPGVFCTFPGVCSLLMKMQYVNSVFCVSQGFSGCVKLENYALNACSGVSYVLRSVK